MDAGYGSKSRARLSPGQLDRIQRYIGSNIADDLSLPELAQIAGISISHLTVLFRRATGTSVHQYVLRRRIQHAISMLSRGATRLCDVAQEAGFADQSHLARCVRRYTGMTPTALSRALHG